MSMIYKGYQIDQPEKDYFVAIPKSKFFRLSASTLDDLHRTIDKYEAMLDDSEKQINKPIN